jgi:hypothetical protein
MPSCLSHSRCHSHAYPAAMVALALATLAGCGDDRPKRVPISGRVLIDGKPLETGVIRLIPADARPATGTIGGDGRFTLGTFMSDDGCVVGKHQVAVIANKPLNDLAIQWYAPKKYSRPETSGLAEIEIAGPRDDLEIRLSWEGGKPFTERIEPESITKH